MQKLACCRQQHGGQHFYPSPQHGPLLATYSPPRPAHCSLPSPHALITCATILSTSALSPRPPSPPPLPPVLRAHQGSGETQARRGSQRRRKRRRVGEAGGREGRRAQGGEQHWGDEGSQGRRVGHWRMMGRRNKGSRWRGVGGREGRGVRGRGRGGDGAGGGEEGGEGVWRARPPRGACRRAAAAALTWLTRLWNRATTSRRVISSRTPSSASSPLTASSVAPLTTLPLPPSPHPLFLLAPSSGSFPTNPSAIASGSRSPSAGLQPSSAASSRARPSAASKPCCSALISAMQPLLPHRCTRISPLVLPLICSPPLPPPPRRSAAPPAPAFVVALPHNSRLPLAFAHAPPPPAFAAPPPPLLLPARLPAATGALAARAGAAATEAAAGAAETRTGLAEEGWAAHAGEAPVAVDAVNRRAAAPLPSFRLCCFQLCFPPHLCPHLSVLPPQSALPVPSPPPRCRPAHPARSAPLLAFPHSPLVLPSPPYQLPQLPPQTRVR
ncbi:unnamed protein product [Closterium sp. NIES-64]|nr:unnamed protein product [Closterium sp. NIES-64]